MEEKSGKLNIKYSGSGCSWSMVGDMIVKHLNWDMDPKWFSTYQKLRDFEPRLVEIYEYYDRAIYMEKIDGQTLLNSMSNDNYLEMCDIITNIGLFCKQKEICFYHHNLHFRNFMFDGNRVRMVDPDSFHFYENGKWV
jgi:hypothetical protein